MTRPGHGRGQRGHGRSQSGAGHSRLLEPQARRPAAQPVLLHQGGQRRSRATAIRSRCRQGRTQIDWECELNIVIGKTAKRVKAENAAEYIFGYTLDNDVSDRGGRADGRHGSDWIARQEPRHVLPDGAVRGAAAVRAESAEARDQVLAERQGDAGLEHRPHDAHVYELVEYASHLMTLQPGDMISSGSPAGVGDGARHADLFQGWRHLDVHDRKHRHPREPRQGGEVDPSAEHHVWLPPSGGSVTTDAPLPPKAERTV